MGVLTRRVVRPSGGVPVVPDGDAFAETYPGLSEFLTRTQWSAEESRVPGSLLLCCEEGVCKVGLFDKDVGENCWVSGDGWDAVLAAAETVLRDGRGDWRKAPPKAAGRGRR